jgi:uncharacterized membrane protein YuzA (DUF378 family)
VPRRGLNRGLGNLVSGAVLVRILRLLVGLCIVLAIYLLLNVFATR